MTSMEMDAQGHTKKATGSVGQKSQGLEKPQDKKHLWLQSVKGPAGAQHQEGGSHLALDAEESETSSIFFFSEEKQLFKIVHYFLSHTKQGTDCTFCF